MFLLIGLLFAVFTVSLATRNRPVPRPRLVTLLVITSVVSLGYMSVGFY